MTVSSETNKDIYTGTGAVSVYPYTFRILDETHLVVTEVLIATGVETLLVLTTDYTVDGVGDSGGGNVTLVAGNLPSTKKLVIRRGVPLKQETDYVENDTFPAESHEDALDKLTMIVQQQQEEIDRLVLRPITETTQLVMPTLDANKFLSNDGSELLWTALSTTDYNGSMLRGLDAGKVATPDVGDIYIATDTKRVYICYVAGTWSVSNHYYGLDANKAVTPIVGEIYIATDTAILYRCVTAGVWGTFIVETIEKIFTEAAHGFAAKDVVRFDGVNWVKAQANSVTNAEYSWIVIESLTANTFKAVLVGFIAGLSGLVAGSVYYLDDDTAGLLTTTEPTDNNDVTKPMLLALSTTTGIVLNQRGRVIGSLGSLIRDADGDTKVETEQSADEDIVRVTAGGVEGQTVYNSGIIDYPKQSAVRVYLASDQSIPTSTTTKLLFATESYDEQNEWASNKFTVTKPGKYLITVNVHSNPFDGNIYKLYIYKNGAIVTRLETTMGASIFDSAEMSDTLELAASDYIEFYVFHSAGINRTFDNVFWNNFATIFKVG